ncbi:MAG: class I SAM-dependent methyltransferase [Planktomarina sp.]
MTTPLAEILIKQIKTLGPMSIADFMAAYLLHPEHGYYTQQQVFGRTGDFITAPEISQMFGELIGLSLAQSWITQGSPKDAVVVELGPGQGTLMHDIKRATKGVAGFADLPVHMVERSPRLREIQAGMIPNVIHHDDVTTLPEVPRFIIANEFLDALPIRQFQRAEDGWSECVVGAQDDALIYGLTPPVPIDALEHRVDDTQIGDVIEICPALPGIVGELSRSIAENGGAALFIDYGDWRSIGDTLQAVQDHQMVPTLQSPGLTDITAHVDFEAIANAAHGLAVSGMTRQGLFLERLAITQRAQSLAKQMQGDALQTHIAAHKRLTHPDLMGDLFKVIGIAQTDAHLPPGLDPAP